MLGANPFKSQTIAPMDLLLKYPGWQNTNIVVPYISGERSDVLDAKFPIWTSAKKDLHQGEIPFWNYQRGGKPGLTFTNSLLSPAFFTFAVVKDDALGFYLANLVNVLIGLFGMYLFLRLFLNRSASVFGAFIFMFSGFNSAWFFWAHVHTAIWTPWVFFAVYKYLVTQDKRFLPLVTVTMLMLNLGGFPMIAVMTYMSVAIMFVIFLLSQRPALKIILKIILHLGIFSILSVMIALPFIFPLTELLTWMGGMGYRHGGSGFKLHDFELFINPDLYRYPRVETTFYVGILPIVFLFLSLFFLAKKPVFIAIFSLILFIYSLTIAFTLISPELIHKVPTLNSSLLTRFGYLIGVSLAMVSAYTLHEIMKRISHRKWLFVFVIGIFTVQIWDQKNLFDRFNGSVPNASFLPQTKSISYLQENLGSFEYIIADKGFLIAGTLGGYGLNDWYAHSFHNATEKKILSTLVYKPFQTPTSAIFPFHHIDLDSPYMDFLNVKAILSTSYAKHIHHAIWDNDRKQAPSPVMPSNTLVQPFHLDENMEVLGMTFLMATFAEKHASSDVVLTLKYKDNEIASARVKKEEIRDNTWVRFFFDSPKILLAGDYTVSLEMLDKNTSKALVIWTNIEEKEQKLLVNNHEINSSLKMAFIQDNVLNEKYTLLNLEANIHILLNKNVSPGAYYIVALDINQSIEHDATSTKIVSNTKIEIDYIGDKKGWIVLPMRAYPGWTATVNEKKVDIVKFLDMLPAVEVKGKSKIIISYNPSYNIYTYSLALLGLVLLLLSILIFRKKETE